MSDVTYTQDGTLIPEGLPARILVTDRAQLTPDRSSPVALGLSGPHPSLETEERAVRAMLDMQYRNVNGETTSRIVLVGTIEEGTRSLQSMNTWLAFSAAQLKVAGVNVQQLRRVRNALTALIPNWHRLGEDIATLRRR
jgi:hypothetical protein